jgi:hypothetical protein
MDIAIGSDGKSAVLTVTPEEFGTIVLGLDAYLKTTDPLVRYAPALEISRGHARSMNKVMDDRMKEAMRNG